MTKKKTVTPKAASTGTSISHCNITMEPAKEVNEHMASAVRALAEACTANARALEEAAKRLAGPPDHRAGIYLNGQS